MKYEIKGGRSFSYIEAQLNPKESLITESGAMASMDTGLNLRSRMNGGFFAGLLIKFFGKESFFVNTFTNESSKPQSIMITKNTPGQIACIQLNNEDLFIQPGAFIAATAGITFKLRWAGFASFFAKEGLFRLKISGSGLVWVGAFGAIVEREIDGSYLVDTGHLLSYHQGIRLKLQLAGGLFSSFFGGEGFVLNLKGKGKITLQTRSLDGLAGWLNPRF